MKKYEKISKKYISDIWEKWWTYGNRTLLGHMGKYGGHMTATPPTIVGVLSSN
jgi:hypothetical protein